MGFKAEWRNTQRSSGQQLLGHLFQSRQHQEQRFSFLSCSFHAPEQLQTLFCSSEPQTQSPSEDFQRHAEFQILSFMSTSRAVFNRDTARVVQARPLQPSAFEPPRIAHRRVQKSKILSENRALAGLWVPRSRYAQRSHKYTRPAPIQGARSIYSLSRGRRRLWGGCSDLSRCLQLVCRGNITNSLG